ncbi:MAG: radical SAM/SPASM domain-containing protein [Candidatus Bruticola sp.]
MACQKENADRAYDLLPEEIRQSTSKTSYIQFVMLSSELGIIENGRFVGVILNNEFVTSRSHLSAPLRVHLQLTKYCNLNCPYCWADAGRSRLDELTLPQLDKLFSELCSMGVFILDIGGGEPLARKDFSRVVALANEYGMCVNVSTNATVATKSMEEQLSKVKINSFRISMDAGSEKIYDNIRGVRSYRKAMRGIAHLRSACPDASFSFHVTLFKGNHSEIPSIVKKAEELKVDKLIFRIALPVGRGANYRDRLFGPDEIAKPLEIINNIPKNKQLNIEIESPTPPKFHKIRVFDGLGCECGRTSVHISSNGLVYPSALLSAYPAWKAGDIRQTSFFNIWNKSAVLESWRSDAVCRKCKACDKVASCRGGCRTRAFVLKDDIKAKDPFCTFSGDLQS